MPATVEEVRKIIEAEFEGSNVSGITEDDHRIGGIIVWPGFKSLDSIERNQLVTEKVRDRLGLRGLNVGLLFPRASEEDL